MPSPAQLEFAGTLGKELLVGSEGGGLNLLRIAGADASTLAAGGEATQRIIAASQAMEGGLSKLSTTIQPESLLMDTKFAAMRAPGLIPGRFGPVATTVGFDSASDLGRVWTARQVPMALIARVPASSVEPVAYGSGMAVRTDGLVVAARHTIREANTGDIWVRFPHQPIAPFKANILAEDKAQDLILLKPQLGLGRPVVHVPITDFADSSRIGRGADLVTIGGQNAVFTRPSMLAGDTTMAQGKFIENANMHFAGEPTVLRTRAGIAGEYGLSGGGTYDVRSGKFVGTMLGGFDNTWSGLAPSNSVRQIIVTNFRR